MHENIKVHIYGPCMCLVLFFLTKIAKEWFISMWKDTEPTHFSSLYSAYLFSWISFYFKEGPFCPPPLKAIPSKFVKTLEITLTRVNWTLPGINIHASSQQARGWGHASTRQASMGLHLVGGRWERLTNPHELWGESAQPNMYTPRSLFRKPHISPVTPSAQPWEACCISVHARIIFLP